MEDKNRSVRGGAYTRAVFKGGQKNEPSQRQQKRGFTGTFCASLSWDLLYFKGWRLAVGGCWRQLAVVGGGWWSLMAVLRAVLSLTKKKSGFLRTALAYTVMKRSAHAHPRMRLQQCS